MLRVIPRKGIGRIDTLSAKYPPEIALISIESYIVPKTGFAYSPMRFAATDIVLVPFPQHSALSLRISSRSFLPVELQSPCSVTVSSNFLCHN